jgi:PAS domain-containing protein
MDPEPTAAGQAPDQSKTVEMNEALVLGSLRQHALVDEAEKLNALLRATMAERAQATEGLRQNEALFSAIIDQSPGAVFVLDAQLCFHQLNPKTLDVFGHLGP